MDLSVQKLILALPEGWQAAEVTSGQSWHPQAEIAALPILLKVIVSAVFYFILR